MKLSIGHRLFASVLLAILAVTACGVALMQYKVRNSFSEYALRIELDRLGELADALDTHYEGAHDWRFLPRSARARERWIADEMLRLQVRRNVAAPVAAMPAAAMPAAPVAPVMPAAPAAPTAPARPAMSASMLSAPAAPALLAAPAAAPVAPVAPAAPMPPMPPLPPLPPPPIEPTAAVEPVGPIADASELDQLALQDRVTLLDADGAYLAGRRGAAPGARRALSVGGATIGYLFVTRAERPSDAMAGAFLQQLKASLLPIIALSIALSAVAAVLLSAHFRKPILRLAAGAGALASGRFDTRLDATRGDELGDLARRFNQLAQHLSAAEESRRQWVADTSHELRTPLSVLRAQLEAIEDGVRDASPHTVAAMLRQVLSLNQLIDDLYALARADLGAPGYLRQPLDVWALAADHAQLFAHKFSAAGLQLTLGDAPAASIALGDADRLRQVFANLFENCVRYGAAGGRVALSASVHGATLTIDIDDSGPGVPDAALARLGERFFRVEASRSRAHGGAGLGLALCRRIVEAHGGAIAFTRAPIGGLRVRVSLPLVPQ